MLTSEERRQLAEIERNLEASSPRLAVALSRGEPPPGRWPLFVCFAMWCVMPLLAVTAGALIAVIVAVILMSVTARLWYTRN
ncbi:MAG: DUF3040 domain-containing protein [Hamadaea sp.]|uniref:DUF3040 domain-containing protein n=1 Tax=Hamadaea sp. NPDC050747 TaxID=3155789 RepID=UPI0017B49DE8|nr:DUF3040 domain-containing protein [Hamadaea sp.]NUR52664.1 DUF3040 domain-containing protein [Hamadaea sp.]NUT02564.1 DUF3040 domain-containing protein [Hamadaea sp.]